MMSGKVLLDVNMPREVCERLQDLGYDSVYLTEIFSDDIDDNKILDWMEQHRTPILTRDKRFPENGGDLKITLEGESTVKMTRHALHKLMEKQIFPEPLAGSWKNGARKKE